jgi:hypothetical protein
MAAVEGVKMSERKYVELAVADLARSAGVATSDVSVTGVTKQRIPNEPHQPGQVSIDPVLYRYFIELEAAGETARYVGEHGKIRRS